MTEAGLAGILGAAAAELAGVTGTRDGPATIWSARDRPFAVLAGSVAEFRLDPIVAAAARRTPDTTVSPRGDDWVAFRPAELEPYAEDRLRAWFAAAYRRAVA